MMQPAMKPVEEHSPSDIIVRIGSLTRMLRDSLRELGLDQAIAEAAEAIPDARDRLDYVVQMTAQAAERALNSVEASQPHQDAMEKGAKALTKRWDEWFENPIELADARELVTDTRQFLGDVPGHTSFTNAQLLDIMMAQDFQDLTGQVIKRMMDVIQEIERQLLMVLLENIPEPAARPKRENESLLNGPQLDAQGGRGGKPGPGGRPAGQFRFLMLIGCSTRIRTLSRPGEGTARRVFPSDRPVCP